MRYILRIYAMTDYPELEITEKGFTDLHWTRDVLSDGLLLEEKYEILLANYLDLEKEILSQSVQFMVNPYLAFDDLFDSRLEVNRRLVNFLSTARLYVDQIGQHVVKIIGNSSQTKQKIKSLFSSDYDNNPKTNLWKS